MSQQPGPQSDWISHAVGTIESVVTTVRDRTTKPIISVARVLVYGLLAAIVGVAALILLAIIIVRLLTQIPGHHAWLAHAITGAIFLGAGFVLMSKRHAPKESS